MHPWHTIKTLTFTFQKEETRNKQKCPSGFEISGDLNNQKRNRTVYDERQIHDPLVNQPFGPNSTDNFFYLFIVII